MKKHFLGILREKSTTTAAFREATHQLSTLLATEAFKEIPLEEFFLETPIENAKGYRMANRVVFVPILRAGLAMLPAFFSFYPSAPVGFLGIYRHEQTAEPILYYENFPLLEADDAIFLLDPMLATAGSAMLAIRKIISLGVSESNICLIHILASQEGIERLQETFPKIRTIVGETDPILNGDNFIVPGLGDFGDRYFGTVKKKDSKRINSSF